MFHRGLSNRNVYHFKKVLIKHELHLAPLGGASPLCFPTDSLDTRRSLEEPLIRLSLKPVKQIITGLLLFKS